LQGRSFSLPEADTGPAKLPFTASRLTPPAVHGKRTTLTHGESAQERLRSLFPLPTNH